MKLLLDGEVIIEEKIDGRQDCRWWFEEDKTPVVICGEYMKFVHSIYYNRLPDWYVVWDIFVSGNTSYFMDIDTKETFCKRLGIPCTPVLYRGRITEEGLQYFLNRTSSFGMERAEGIVVKNYKNQVFGKIVSEEFVAGIELTGNYLKKPRRMNSVYKSLYNTSK
jgi:energy-coupling factor transporter ATP-binding protein EcfA2